MFAGEARKPDDLLECLGALRDGFRRFREVLQDEQQALTGNDVDRLADLSRLKTEQIDKLNALEKERVRLLAAQDVGPRPQDFDLWLGRQPAATADTARVLQGDLLRVATEARRLNEENGALIAARLQHNQQALNVLRTTANQTPLYGPDGHTQGTGTGRTLGKG